MPVNRKRILVGAALVAAVAAASFASPRALVLVLLVAWHATLILLPVVPIVLGALVAGVRNATVLALFGLTGGALVAYALFWTWRASPTAGAVASIAAIAVSAAAIAWFASRSARSTLSPAVPLGVAAVLWVAYGLFLLAYGLEPSGFSVPLEAVRVRFGHDLPVDNMLPWTFAQHVAAERALVPVSGDWLASDRPPLQTAYFLASLGPLLPRSDLHYQVQATLLQALWVPGMLLLLRGFGLKHGAVYLALATPMLSGFALTHGLYTSPKLLPVAFLAMTAAVLLNGTREELSSPRIGAAVGAAAGVSMLCHGGSAFALLGLALALAALRRIPPARFLLPAAAVGLALMLPWMLYQKYVDPPGNRLLKWHLAGVMSVDSRSFGQTLREAYSALTPEGYLRNKVANVEAILGPPGTSAITVKATASTIDAVEHRILLDAQFLNLVPALGLLALAPLAWLLPRAWRTPQFAASLRLFSVAFATVVSWVILIFPPGGTWTHAGSFVVPCFLFCAAMLALYAASPWLALVGFALHLALTLEMYGRAMPLAAGAALADYRAFGALALVALAATSVLLWKVSAMNKRSEIPS